MPGLPCAAYFPGILLRGSPSITPRRLLGHQCWKLRTIPVEGMACMACMAVPLAIAGLVIWFVKLGVCLFFSIALRENCLYSHARDPDCSCCASNSTITVLLLASLSHLSTSGVPHCSSIGPLCCARDGPRQRKWAKTCPLVGLVRLPKGSGIRKTRGAYQPQTPTALTRIGWLGVLSWQSRARQLFWPRCSLLIAGPGNQIPPLNPSP